MAHLSAPAPPPARCRAAACDLVCATRARPDRIASAHRLRGIAAISVVASHFLVAFWSRQSAVGMLLDVPPLPEVSLTLSKWGVGAFGFGLGSFGVALFFLISGFVIPLSLERLSTGGFLLARAFRIYPVYFACLAVTLATLAVVNQSVGPERPFPFPAWHIAAQATLVRGWLWIVSIDGLSWTLEIEVVFYLVLALLAPMLRSRPAPTLLAMAALVPLLCWGVVAIRPSLPPAALRASHYIGFCAPFIAFMLNGTACHALMRGQIGLRMFLAVVAALIASFALAASQEFRPAIGSYVATLGVFTACYWARDSFARTSAFWDWLADISYPLYAVHAILGYAIMYALVARGAPALVALAAATTAAVVVALLVHVTVEVGAQRLGKDLAARLFPARRAAHEPA